MVECQIEPVMPYTVDERRLKRLLKAAVVEALEERRDFVREVLAEAVEDLSMIHAIEEGAHSATISRTEVFNILSRRR